MKETPLSTLEKSFLLDSLLEGRRLDGRRTNERRPLQIDFGLEPGCCYARQGDTQVLAQVSCHLTEPQATRPNEGQLQIRADYGPLAAPRFCDVHNLSQNEELVELTRLMERCLKESRCLDMESLCVVSEEKVWCIRLDLKVLSHCGNVADVCSVAGLAALCHFKRPEVTLEGDQVTVHPVSERDPVPLAIHHHPICSTFAFFNACTPSQSQEGSANPGANPGADSGGRVGRSVRGRRVVVEDPSWQEEALMDGKIVFGVNPYREICTLHLAGKMLIDKSVVLRYASSAAQYAKTTVDLMKLKLAEDAEARLASREAEVEADGQVKVKAQADAIGLAYALKKQCLLANESSSESVEVDRIASLAEVQSKAEAEMTSVKVTTPADGLVEMVDGDGDEMVDDDENEDVAVVDEVSALAKKAAVAKEVVAIDSDEEEGATVKVGGADLQGGGAEDGKGRGWYKQKW